MEPDSRTTEQSVFGSCGSCRLSPPSFFSCLGKAVCQRHSHGPWLQPRVRGLAWQLAGTTHHSYALFLGPRSGIVTACRDISFWKHACLDFFSRQARLPISTFSRRASAVQPTGLQYPALQTLKLLDISPCPSRWATQQAKTLPFR